MIKVNATYIGILNLSDIPTSTDTPIDIARFPKRLNITYLFNSNLPFLYRTIILPNNISIAPIIFFKIIASLKNTIPHTIKKTVESWPNILYVETSKPLLAVVLTLSVIA